MAARCRHALMVLASGWEVQCALWQAWMSAGTSETSESMPHLCRRGRTIQRQASALQGRSGISQVVRPYWQPPRYSCAWWQLLSSNMSDTVCGMNMCGTHGASNTQAQPFCVLTSTDSSRPSVEPQALGCQADSTTAAAQHRCVAAPWTYQSVSWLHTLPPGMGRCSQQQPPSLGPG